MRCPASAIDRANAGTCSTQRPCRKNVDRVPVPASTSTSRSVVRNSCGRSGCSASKVSATRTATSENAALLLDAGDDDASGERSLEDDEEEHRNEQRHHVPGLDERRLRVVDALEA